MTPVRWHAEEGASVEHALDVGRGALAGVSAGPRVPPRVWVYAASLEGDARVLGAYQHAPDALSDEVRLPVLRRETGGPAAVAGQGVLYLALALGHASALMECPRERVLNRNVRPILAALRRLGGAAHYFGRELVSVNRRPAGLVAWTRRDGAVLLELLLGVDRPFELPESELGLAPSAPRWLGKAPIAAAEALPSRPSATALAEACAAACASMAHREIEQARIAPRPAEPAPPPLPHVRWSSPREAPIGLVRAGLALDDRGVIEDAALAGDFFQDADAPDRLRAALVGGLPTPARLRDAVNATYGPHGAVIEGLRSLQPVLDAFLELAPDPDAK